MRFVNSKEHSNHIFVSVTLHKNTQILGDMFVVFVWYFFFVGWFVGDGAFMRDA